MRWADLSLCLGDFSPFQMGQVAKMSIEPCHPHSSPYLHGELSVSIVFFSLKFKVILHKEQTTRLQSLVFT